MKTSPIFDEIRDEGREEGRQLGQIEGMRSLVLGLGRQKFGKIPTRKQQQALEAIDDLARMQTLAQRLLEADSWGTLLNGGGR
jgi:predicted transposase YdaD